jgi:hypothetical protein
MALIEASDSLRSSASCEPEIVHREVEDLVPFLQDSHLIVVFVGQDEHRVLEMNPQRMTGLEYFPLS